MELQGPCVVLIENSSATLCLLKQSAKVHVDMSFLQSHVSSATLYEKFMAMCKHGLRTLSGYYRCISLPIGSRIDSMCLLGRGVVLHGDVYNLFIAISYSLRTLLNVVVFVLRLFSKCTNCSHSRL